MGKMGLNSILFITILTQLISCRGIGPAIPSASVREVIRPRQAVTSNGPVSTTYVTITALDPFKIDTSSTATTATTASHTATLITTIAITADSPFTWNNACSYASHAIVSCDFISPGFMTLPYSTKELCLCFNATAWTGSVFNNAISNCASWASYADSSIYSEVTSWGGFCATQTSTSASNSATSTAIEVTPTQSNPSSEGIPDKTRAQEIGLIVGTTVPAVAFLIIGAFCLTHRNRRLSSHQEVDTSTESTTSDTSPSSEITKEVPRNFVILDTPPSLQRCNTL